MFQFVLCVLRVNNQTMAHCFVKLHRQSCCQNYSEFSPPICIRRREGQSFCELIKFYQCLKVVRSNFFYYSSKYKGDVIAVDKLPDWKSEVCLFAKLIPQS